MGNQITGEGGPTFSLAPERMASILRDGLGTVGRGSRVLAIIPDKTRDDNTNLLFPIASKLLFDRGIETLDVLVAQGTHPPMSDQEKSEKIGNGSGADFIMPGRIFDHRWNTESELVQLGTIEAERVSELSSGLLTEAIPVRLNRL